MGKRKEAKQETWGKEAREKLEVGRRVGSRPSRREGRKHQGLPRMSGDGGNPTRRQRLGRARRKGRRIERGYRPAGEVVGTIAVTTLVAWYTLLVVHTHDPSPCLPRFPLFLSVFVPRPSLSRFPLHVRAFPPGANAPCNARVHTRERIQTRARILGARVPAYVCVYSLASLFFRLLSRVA